MQPLYYKCHFEIDKADRILVQVPALCLRRANVIASRTANEKRNTKVYIYSDVGKFGFASCYSSGSLTTAGSSSSGSASSSSSSASSSSSLGSRGGIVLPMTVTKLPPTDHSPGSAGSCRPPVGYCGIYGRMLARKLGSATSPSFIQNCPSADDRGTAYVLQKIPEKNYEWRSLYYKSHFAIDQGRH